MSGGADVVVIGAGIAGVSTAFHLAIQQEVERVVIVDPRPPLSLTSDKSTECYRNWWPDAPMVGLMNRSIDLLERYAEESQNFFGLSRRGYLFVTADTSRLEAMTAQAAVTSSFGAGDLRTHPGPIPYGPAADGVDIMSTHEITTHFPYLTDGAVGAVHVRRAGWFSAQQLGGWMLARARERGVDLVPDEVAGILTEKGAISGVALKSGATIPTRTVVVAAGPMSRRVAALSDVDLPLFSELHLKVSFRDHLAVIPRDAPMIIWSDPQTITWTPEEREGLEEVGRTDLLGEMPIYCHGRPEGGKDSSYFIGLWEYHQAVVEPIWPLPDDPLYPEVVLRGLTTMVPGLSAYSERLPEAFVDGGYYSKTEENRPLIGPAGPEGLYLVCGLSGFGVMVSAGAGDLVARHVAGADLPSYADAFLLTRYEDPAYLRRLAGGTDPGQL